MPSTSARPLAAPRPRTAPPAAAPAVSCGARAAAPAGRRLPVGLAAGLLGLAAAALAGCNGLPEPEPVAGPVLLEPSQPDEVVSARIEGARAAEADGDYEVALAAFQRILAENPTVTEAYLGVGRVRLEQDRPELAEPAFRRAARLEPRSFDAQFGHGTALRLLGRLTDAVLALQRALTIRPEDFAANRDISLVLLDLGRIDAARTFARRAVEIAPDDGQARANLGAIATRAGDTEEAIEQYVAALELLGNDPRILNNLVLALAAERRYEEAINTAEQLLRIEPSPDVWERLGWCNFKLRRFDAARDAYEAAIAMDPDHWPSLNGLGVSALNAWLLSERTDARERTVAADAFRRSLRINPDQQPVINLLIEYRL